MTRTTRTVALLSALGICSFVLAATVARWSSATDVSTLSGLFTGFGVGLFIVGARQYIKGRRLAQGEPTHPALPRQQ